MRRTEIMRRNISKNQHLLRAHLDSLKNCRKPFADMNQTQLNVMGTAFDPMRLWRLNGLLSKQFLQHRWGFTAQVGCAYLRLTQNRSRHPHIRHRQKRHCRFWFRQRPRRRRRLFQPALSWKPEWSNPADVYFGRGKSMLEVRKRILELVLVRRLSCSQF